MLKHTRLVLFDLDGTLVDSQATIVTCAQAAFAAAGLPAPEAEAVRRIVGLSLVQAMSVLLGRDDALLASRIAEHYREAFVEHRARPDFDEPLFPGVVEVLEWLAARDLALGIATGKGMRGLQAVLEHHGLGRYFVTLQTADLHPSKPHPSMVEAGMRETGFGPDATIVVGDTSYDIAMARSAGARGIGVAWGNHPRAELEAAGAAHILESLPDLVPLFGAAR
jgi:phosphoglycolate phosphatase